MIERSDIVAPASSGNLGPGFDALSVSLQLYLRVRVLEVLPGRPDTIESIFKGASAPRENGVERAFRAARVRIGHRAPGVRVEISSDIPVRAGLGSSAAATIAGLRLYETLTQPIAEPDLLALAADLEGHPDNVSACLLGGLTVSCRLEDGRVVARPAPWPERLRFVIATPAVALATKEARGVLPASVPLADAVFNLQRSLLLLRAVEDERYEDLREAFQDRLHQPARSALVPALRQVLAMTHPAVLGAFLSGSGPSIAVVALPGREAEAAAALEEIYSGLALPVVVRVLAAHQPTGAGLPPMAIERENTA